MLKKNYSKNKIEAGCDEAGRGCLAGPVVAAAVILPSNFKHPLLNDSKKMTEKQRELLFPVIKKEALAYGVGIVTNEEIDKINILNASFLAMHRAVDLLGTRPELLLIDGNRFNPYNGVEHVCIVKGDSKYLSIAAASVLAKVTRDEFMNKAAAKHDGYDWENNKGYPTKKHRLAIKKFGTTELHRMSFNLLGENQLKLDI